MAKLNKNVTQRNKYNKNKLWCLLAFFCILLLSPNAVLASSGYINIYAQPTDSSAQLGFTFEVLSGDFKTNGVVQTTIGYSDPYGWEQPGQSMLIYSVVDLTTNCTVDLNYRYTVWGYDGATVPSQNYDVVSGSVSCSSGSSVIIPISYTASACSTNPTIYLYDTFSGPVTVMVHAANGAVLAGPLQYTGPLNTTYNVGSVSCTNVPCFASYSNSAGCFTNHSLNVSTTWTNDVVYSIYYANGQVADGPNEQPGPFSLTYISPVMDCTNFPMFVVYSNLPPCYTNLVFAVQNNAPVWRIMAVQNSDQSSGGLGQTIVAPGGQFNYTLNNVICMYAGNYTIWAGGADGNDNVVNMQIGATGPGGVTATSVPLGPPGTGIGTIPGNPPAVGTNTITAPGITNYVVTTATSPGPGTNQTTTITTTIATGPPPDNYTTTTTTTTVNNNTTSGTGGGSPGGSGGSPGNSGGGTGGVTNAPTSGTFPTNSTLPISQPPNSTLPVVTATNTSIIWSNTNQDLTALTASIKDMGNVLYNGIAAAANQAHSDASGINSNLTASATQAHSDAAGINTNFVAGTSQAHTDANAAVAAGTANANGIIAAVNAGTANSSGIISAIQAVSALNHSDNVTALGQAGFVGANAHTDATAAHLDANTAHTDAAGIASAVLSLTNLLARSTDANTNSESAQESRMAGLIPSTATNSDAATAAASAIFSVPLSTLGDDIAALETPPDIGTDPGHSSIWEMDFVGQHIDLDPVDNFPVVFTFLHGLMTFLLSSGYLLWVGREYLKLVQMLATASMGGVPDMEVSGGGEAGALGFKLGGSYGGNFMGVLVACIVPSMFLGIWVIVVNVVIVPLTTWMGLFSGISSLFNTVASTSVGSGGLHLLFAAFPASLFISLATAKISLQLTMAKATLLAVTASRYLFGR